MVSEVGANLWGLLLLPLFRRLRWGRRDALSLLEELTSGLVLYYPSVNGFNEGGSNPPHVLVLKVPPDGC